jgi:hypothetical protein
MSYTVLRGHWCGVIVLHVQAPTEDKNDMKDSFYKEPEHSFDKFPKSHKKFCYGISMPK